MPVFVKQLAPDLSDGMVLLTVINHVQPGLVDWSKVRVRRRAYVQRVSAESVANRIPVNVSAGISHLIMVRMQVEKPQPVLGEGDVKNSYTTLNRFHSVSNCNYGIELCRTMPEISLINIAGNDLTDQVQEARTNTRTHTQNRQIARLSPSLSFFLGFPAT